MSTKSLLGFRSYRRIHILDWDTGWDSAPLILCIRSWMSDVTCQIQMWFGCCWPLLQFIYSVSQNDMHMAYFCDLSRIFADSLNPWTPQVLTVDQHRPACRIPSAKHCLAMSKEWTSIPRNSILGIHQAKILKQKCCRRISNVGLWTGCQTAQPYGCKSDFKWAHEAKILAGQHQQFPFSLSWFYTQLGPSRTVELHIWSSFPCNSDCSSTTFFLYPWNQQCLRSYLWAEKPKVTLTSMRATSIKSHFLHKIPPSITEDEVCQSPRQAKPIPICTILTYFVLCFTILAWFKITSHSYTRKMAGVI